MRRILTRAGVAVGTAAMLLTLAMGPAHAEGASCTMDGVSYADGVGLLTSNGGGWYTQQTCHNGSWQWEWTRQLPAGDVILPAM